MKGDFHVRFRENVGGAIPLRDSIATPKVTNQTYTVTSQRWLINAMKASQQKKEWITNDQLIQHPIFIGSNSNALFK